MSSKNSNGKRSSADDSAVSSKRPTLVRQTSLPAIQEEGVFAARLIKLEAAVAKQAADTRETTLPSMRDAVEGEFAGRIWKLEETVSKQAAEILELKRARMMDDEAEEGEESSGDEEDESPLFDPEDYSDEDTERERQREEVEAANVKWEANFRKGSKKTVEKEVEDSEEEEEFPSATQKEHGPMPKKRNNEMYTATNVAELREFMGMGIVPYTTQVILDEFVKQRARELNLPDPEEQKSAPPSPAAAAASCLSPPRIRSAPVCPGAPKKKRAMDV